MATAPNVDEEAVTHPLLSTDHELYLRRSSTSNVTSQVAIVGANVCPIESLDYELVHCPFSYLFVFALY